MGAFIWRAFRGGKKNVTRRPGEQKRAMRPNGGRNYLRAIPLWSGARNKNCAAVSFFSESQSWIFNRALASMEGIAEVIRYLRKGTKVNGGMHGEITDRLSVRA
jgi:hypothetical protein